MAEFEKISGVPEGLHSVTPYLFVSDTAAAIEFYKKAFGAEEVGPRNALPDGRIIHARIRIGDSTIMLSDTMEKRAPSDSPFMLHVYCDDVDKTWKNAVAAGAKIDMPIDNMFWGERYGQLTDPFGHSWSLSTRLKVTKEEMEELMKKQMPH